MIESDIIFEYPSKEYSKKYEMQISEMEKNYMKTIKLILIIISFGIVMIVLDSIFAKFTYSFIFLLAALLLFFISIQIYKKSEKKYCFHMLKIKAYSNYMILNYRHACSEKILTVQYDDVVSAKFNDNNYTSFQIVFYNSKESHITKIASDGSNMQSEENIFIFKINPMSYEQAFFLYYAINFFDIENFKQRKIQKQFGDPEDYINNIM